MQSQEIREKFLKFFEERGHVVVPSSSLISENDPSTLFTGSGMQPLVPYLLGEEHPSGKRLVNSQKSFRAEDIEEVGDNRHTTFFEMLGNWSLGDYFKEEQLPWLFEFLTEEIKLEPHKLYVSVFAGDEKNNIPKDTESVEIWKKLFKQKGIEAKEVELDTVERGAEKGMQGGRIFYYGTTKNWWTRFGSPENMPVGEPGGPDSEIFYDFGTEHDPKFGKECHPNCDCGRFLEIGNSVFMEYKKTDAGFEALIQKNVDFGGGLERIAAASNDNSDVFEIDIFRETTSVLPDSLPSRVKRIIADHLRAGTFLVADGVEPSNKERGYVLRRILRRAMVHAKLNNLKGGWIRDIISSYIDSYKSHYEYLDEDRDRIIKTIEAEHEKFSTTLEKGLRELDKYETITGTDAFYLFQSFGIPWEITEELMTQKGVSVNRQEFEEEFKKHQDLSRSSSAGVFKGGLVDHEPQTLKHHTAHHLLLAALRQILGSHVFQRGSNVSAERLRIDFSQPEKMTPEQIKQVEDIVNQAITDDLEVVRDEMQKSEAEKLGALAEFGAKYGDVVSVYTIYNKDGSVFSREFCGGPHVQRTSELGKFKIIKEEASSAGIRRIKAKTE
ncbi:MAG: hypothetical protein A3J48_03860 [Candidatus Doudnabacteria bacterium RIFCSPHIGHO2_02_FULL_46_11]|uniref:alanine--tRNA ligase n=1 Tax=Candidatus Doudnabacteria bacterium RIFCSPHIGHO2_02_FULL_46_11 TaxID=1817832 RepID=A0A1F5P862_9BACT|nr:MAG: hypothetical protein A3J48_03860 [Candidatus Doudnabacteria bacterium RIFCSPHIGHO2_02_FULL_46_11]